MLAAPPREPTELGLAPPITRAISGLVPVKCPSKTASRAEAPDLPADKTGEIASVSTITKQPTKPIAIGQPVTSSDRVKVTSEMRRIQERLFGAAGRVAEAPQGFGGEGQVLPI